MILVFDRSVAGWFCGNLGFSAQEAHRARVNDRPVDCAQYVAEFRKTVDMLKLFGIDANVETDVAFGKNTLDIIKHAEICKDGERYVVVQDSKHVFIDNVPIPHKDIGRKIFRTRKEAEDYIKEMWGE